MPTFPARRLRLPAVALLAASLAFSAPAMAAQKDDVATIEVSAQSNISVAPDIALFQAGVVTSNAKAEAAMTENRTKMNAVFEALKKAGIADKDIQSAGITINPQYRYEENQPPAVTGYQASNTVSVKLRDMNKIGDVIDALVGQGVNQLNGPNFDVEDRDAALEKARIDAVAKARARAEAYAAAAGVKILRLLKITEQGEVSPPQPYPMMRMAAMDAASKSTPVAPGEVQLGVSLGLVYEIGNDAALPQ